MGWHDYRGCIREYKQPSFEELQPYTKDINSFYTPLCRENELRILKNLDPKKIYTTVRIYNTDTFTTLNGVLGEHLKEHINFNYVMRFGCALFVNGLVVQTGYLGETRCLKVFEEFRTSGKLILFNRPTIPYN